MRNVKNYKNYDNFDSFNDAKDPVPEIWCADDMFSFFS